MFLARTLLLVPPSDRKHGLSSPQRSQRIEWCPANEVFKYILLWVDVLYGRTIVNFSNHNRWTIDHIYGAAERPNELHLLL